MDISSNKPYPSCALSNFAPHPFVIDGVRCNSMEGFLQSLKFKSMDMQKYVCTLVGRAAKLKGKDKNWRRTQVLYWLGKEYRRDSLEYQVLLDRAYNELNKNEGFRRALKVTGSASISHSMGKTNINETILTSNEFCSRLIRLRSINNERYK